MTKPLLLLVLLLGGCAKHGVMIETDKNFNGDLTVGWGPTAVISGKVVGEMRLCIPSKSAVKDAPDDNWCRSWMDRSPAP